MTTGSGQEPKEASGGACGEADCVEQRPHQHGLTVPDRPDDRKQVEVHTIDVGHVHVGRPVGPHAPMTGKWECADDCPHPDHGDQP